MQSEQLLLQQQCLNPRFPVTQSHLLNDWCHYHAAMVAAAWLPGRVRAFSACFLDFLDYSVLRSLHCSQGFSVWVCVLFCFLRWKKVDDKHGVVFTMSHIRWLISDVLIGWPADLEANAGICQPPRCILRSSSGSVLLAEGAWAQTHDPCFTGASTVTAHRWKNCWGISVGAFQGLFTEQNAAVWPSVYFFFLHGDLIRCYSQSFWSTVAIFIIRTSVTQTDTNDSMNFFKIKDTPRCMRWKVLLSLDQLTGNSGFVSLRIKQEFLCLMFQSEKFPLTLINLDN